MIKEANKKWIFVALVALLVFGLHNTTKKESVAAIEGQPCTYDEDCPCWGEYTVSVIENATAYGIGIARCRDIGTCDMQYCFDIEPVGEWLRENPMQWMKDNIVITVALIGLLVFVFVLFPKK